MSNQSPTANGPDQQGADITNREPQPPAQDESGFSSGTDRQKGKVSPELAETDDPSKD